MNRNLLPITLDMEGSTKLAIPTGIKGNEFAITRLLAIKNQPGWVVSNGEVREWKFQGFTERDNAVFLYGENFTGITLYEILETLPKDGFYRFKQLVNSLFTLKSNGITPFEIYSDAIIFNEEGSVLFLPPVLMKNINGTRPLPFKIESYEILNNPDLKGEKRLCHSLAIMLYRILTEQFPFQGKSEEEIHDQMRNMDILQPNLIVPELSEEVSQWIYRNLTNKSEDSAGIDLNAWYENMKKWKRENLYREITMEERRQLLESAEEKRKKAEKTYRRRVFWERNWKTVLIVSLIVIISGAVLGSILKNVFSPRKTRGFSPIQVVEAFYDSLNKLDTITLEDCVIGDAGKQEKNEVTNLYVISRVSMGYEGKSHIIPAPAWEKAGRPELKPPNAVYGVLNLKIQRISSEPKPVFLATYEKWLPLSKEEIKGEEGREAGKNQPDRGYTGYRVKDRLFLKKDRGDWVIFRIERLEFKPLEK